MLYVKKLESIIFYSIIFLISIQLGKHFWPPFAFLQGVRIDYLSPTLYLSDIFIIALLALRLFTDNRSFLRFFSKSFLLALFLFSVLISTLFANSIDSSVYWSIKILEIILFSWYISDYKFNKVRLFRLVDVLVIAAVFQSVIAIFQFILQKSIGGSFYFIGERVFNVSTVGIATFFTKGQEILRPYGTFPHPNVLALFLSIALIFSIYFILNTKNSIRSLTYSLVSLVILLGLLVTASRVIILLTIIISLVQFIKLKKHLIYILIGVAIIMPIYILLFSGRYLIWTSIIETVQVRLSLFALNINIFKDNIFFGVGLNNTFFNSTLNSDLPIYVRFQPVHNIYMHMLVQLGAVGGVAIGIFIYKIVRRIRTIILIGKFPLVVIGLLAIEILIVGLFDHFLVTLQQGMLMGALIIGLLFNGSIVRLAGRL